MDLNCSLQRYSKRLFLKHLMGCAHLTLWGRLFQYLGPSTRMDRVPDCVLVLGTKLLGTIVVPSTRKQVSGAIWDVSPLHPTNIHEVFEVFSIKPFALKYCFAFVSVSSPFRIRSWIFFYISSMYKLCVMGILYFNKAIRYVLWQIIYIN